MLINYQATIFFHENMLPDYSNRKGYYIKVICLRPNIPANSNTCIRSAYVLRKVTLTDADK